MLYIATRQAMSDEYLQLLSSTNKENVHAFCITVYIASLLFLKHPDTSEEVCYCCEDIKVLASKEGT